MALQDDGAEIDFVPSRHYQPLDDDADAVADLDVEENLTLERGGDVLQVEPIPRPQPRSVAFVDESESSEQGAEEIHSSDDSSNDTAKEPNANDQDDDLDESALSLKSVATYSELHDDGELARAARAIALKTRRTHDLFGTSPAAAATSENGDCVEAEDNEAFRVGGEGALGGDEEQLKEGGDDDDKGHATPTNKAASTPQGGGSTAVYADELRDLRDRLAVLERLVVEGSKNASRAAAMAVDLQPALSSVGPVSKTRPADEEPSLISQAAAPPVGCELRAQAPLEQEEGTQGHHSGSSLSGAARTAAKKEGLAKDEDSGLGVEAGVGRCNGSSLSRKKSSGGVGPPSSFLSLDMFNPPPDEPNDSHADQTAGHNKTPLVVHPTPPVPKEGDEEDEDGEEEGPASSRLPLDPTYVPCPILTSTPTTISASSTSASYPLDRDTFGFGNLNPPPLASTTATAAATETATATAGDSDASSSSSSSSSSIPMLLPSLAAPTAAAAAVTAAAAEPPEESSPATAQPSLLSKSITTLASSAATLLSQETPSSSKPRCLSQSSTSTSSSLPSSSSSSPQPRSPQLRPSSSSRNLRAAATATPTAGVGVGRGEILGAGGSGCHGRGRAESFSSAESAKSASASSSSASSSTAASPSSALTRRSLMMSPRLLKGMDYSGRAWDDGGMLWRDPQMAAQLLYRHERSEHHTLHHRTARKASRSDSGRSDSGDSFGGKASSAAAAMAATAAGLSGKSSSGGGGGGGGDASAKKSHIAGPGLAVYDKVADPSRAEGHEATRRRWVRTPSSHNLKAAAAAAAAAAATSQGGGGGGGGGDERRGDNGVAVAEKRQEADGGDGGDGDEGDELEGFRVTFAEFMRSDLLAPSTPVEIEEAIQRSVTNFLKVPLSFERFVWFGVFTSLDMFLYVLTFLPMRSALSVCRWALCVSLTPLALLLHSSALPESWFRAIAWRVLVLVLGDPDVVRARQQKKKKSEEASLEEATLEEPAGKEAAAKEVNAGGMSGDDGDKEVEVGGTSGVAVAASDCEESNEGSREKKAAEVAGGGSEKTEASEETEGIGVDTGSGAEASLSPPLPPPGFTTGASSSLRKRHSRDRAFSANLSPKRHPSDDPVSASSSDDALKEASSTSVGGTGSINGGGSGSGGGGGGVDTAGRRKKGSSLSEVLHEVWCSPDSWFRWTKPVFHRSHAYDLLRVLLFAGALGGLQLLDMSRVYHYIRGQAMIKLYVIISMVEIFDRLISSFGQDVLDSLYWTVRCNPRSVRLFLDVPVALAYILVHACLFFVNVATLNVAINSADGALTGLLISGNFAEIKTSVFKKFDANNLFQVASSDVTERFKLFVFMLLVLLLNMVQNVDNDKKVLWNFSMQTLLVFACEVSADWIKHAFITKFNGHDFGLYKRFTLVLVQDVTEARHDFRSRPVLDHTHSLARRIGLAQLPLACTAMRFMQDVWARVVRRFGVSGYDQAKFLCLAYAALFLLKVLTGIILAGTCAEYRIVEETRKAKAKAAPPPPTTTTSTSTTANSFSKGHDAKAEKARSGSTSKP